MADGEFVDSDMFFARQMQYASNVILAVTREVVSARPRRMAARPSATVLPTPPQAPISHNPTRRSLIK